jgi:hypothetical protein
VSRIGTGIGEVLQIKMAAQEENFGETKLNAWEQEYFWQYSDQVKKWEILGLIPGRLF